MWLKASIFVIAATGVPLMQGCRQTSRQTTQSDEPVPAEKTRASADGFEEARRDIANLRQQLKTKSPEQLIASFIPPGSQRHGGYQYYYGYMANAAVSEELQSRRAAARKALERHANDDTRIFEGVNGPGDTVGRVCRQLIDAVDNPPTRPAT